jgi:glycosyltransferase involved in cell wall biosynthesis
MNMNTSYRPFISFVILTRNRSDLVKRAIYSALGQTYTNMEIVIIDDNSTDNTLEVLNKEFAEEIQKGKMRIIHNAETKGQANNRNMSLEIAKGELISYLDDDDFIFPDKIQRQVEEMEKTGAKASTCGMIWMEGPTICKATLVNNKKVGFENGGPPSTWLIDKEVMKEVGGFDPAFPANVDGEFLIRLNRKYEFCYAAEPLYVHFYFPEQITADAKKKVAGWKLTIAKHGKGFSKEELAAAYSKLAVFSVFTGEKKLEYPMKALEALFSLKNLFLVCLFLFPHAIVKKVLNIAMDVQNYPKSYISRYANTHAS